MLFAGATLVALSLFCVSMPHPHISKKEGRHDLCRHVLLRVFMLIWSSPRTTFSSEKRRLKH